MLLNPHGARVAGLPITAPDAEVIEGLIRESNALADDEAAMLRRHRATPVRTAFVLLGILAFCIGSWAGVITLLGRAFS